MLLIGNGLLITLDEKMTVLENGAVLLDGDSIAKVGSTPELLQEHPRAEFLDAEGRLIMPGMINSHMHLYSTFARGLALPEPPGNFLEILERLWWRLDKVLTPEDVYYSAVMPLVDCVRNGTTTIIDHHASPGAIGGSLKKIVEAAGMVGVRTALAYEVSDRDGEAVCTAGIEENMAAINEYQAASDKMFAALFGLHASLTLSDATLKRCRQALEGYDVGYHIHVAEGPEDLEDSLRRYDKRVVQRLADAGILGPKTVAAHCVHVDDSEIALLQETGTMVVHNPQSNMGNAVGVAPVLKMLEQGVLVGLGTDGYTADMFESIKAANTLHKLDQKNPGAAWEEVPAMAFANNREIARRVFGRELGIIRPGAAADVLLVDYEPATPLRAKTAYAHLLFGVSGGLVDTTIINGQIKMLHKEIRGLDIKTIASEARRLAQSLWNRL